MTRILSIDPGISNCAITLLENRVPIQWNNWINYKGGVMARCSVIVSTLQNIAETYKPDAFVCEKYYGVGGVNANTNYQRGMLDGLVKIGMGHLNQFWINPSSLKKWVTNNGHAKKREMLPVLERDAKDLIPDVYRHWLSNKEYTEHLLESWMLGVMGHWMFNRQWRQVTELTQDKIELLRRLEDQEDWIPPILPAMVHIPICLE